MIRPKIGLALGGGGARGLAHIGVLKVLERHHVPIHYLSGTSMGGLVAAMWAGGYSAEDLAGQVLDLLQMNNLIRVFDLSPDLSGLLRGDGLRQYLSDVIWKTQDFKDLRLPLALCTVDLKTGREVILRKGNLVDAMRATMSVPGAFSPVAVNNYQLVDGAVRNNVPVDVAYEMGADVVIAVDVWLDFSQNIPGMEPLVAPSEPPIPLFGMGKTLWDSGLIMVSALTEFRLQLTPPDILIRPDIPDDVTLFQGWARVDEMVKVGEQAAINALSMIEQLLKPT